VVTLLVIGCDGGLQMADAVSCLALQRPVDVVMKLVDSSVESRGHTECIVKLLRRLPALAEITTDDGCSVLLGRLDQQIVSCSPQTLHNITKFCHLLLVSPSISLLRTVVLFWISCAYRNSF